jgi:hypothetical protein
MATNDEIRQSIEALEEANKLLDKNSEKYKTNKIAIDALNDSLLITVDYLEKQKKQLELQAETHKLISEQTGINIDNLKKQSEIKQLGYEIDIKKLQKSIEETEDVNERLKLQRQLVEVLKEQTKEVEKQKDLARAEQSGRSLANLLGISESNKNSLTYQIFNDPKSVFDGFKKESISAGGLASSFGVGLLMKVQEATVQAFYANDKAISSFVAATGASSEYNRIINATARGNTNLGISFEEAGRAVTDLYTNLNTFTTLSKSAQAELTVTTAKLEKLGISGGDTARSIMTLSEMMQISETQAAAVVEEFAAMGQAIGVSSKQMISDFAGVKDQLAVFGSEMNKVFTDLEAQSKATGVAVNDLLNLTNKFDTFSSAANQVGKLNAILGGPYLSTMAMIENTDPTERINMLRQAVDNAGMSFAELGYYEKKAIMEAGGFKSVEEAQRVLSMSAGDYAKQLENQRATQEELNGAIQRAQPIQDKLSLIMANFAITMGPVVELVSGFLSFLAMIVDNPVVGFIIKLAVVVGGLLAVMNPVAAAIGGVVLVLTQLHDILLVPNSPILFDVLSILPIIFDSIGNAAEKIANSISIAAKSFMELHDAVVKNPQALLLMSAAITSLGAALTVGAVGGLANKFASMFGADMASQIEDIADAVSKFDENKLLNFKVVLEKAVEISNPEVASGFDSFRENFEAVVKATAEFEIKKAQSFTNLLTATQNLSSNLQLKQDIKVMVDSQQIAARIEKKQGNAAIQGV